MAKKQMERLAERFLHDQCEIMKKYGNEPRLDKQRKDAVLRDMTRAFDGMRSTARVAPGTRH
jgi:hypothetical protein